MNITYFFDNLIESLVNHLKISLTILLVKPTERYPSEFFLSNTRFPHINLIEFKSKIKLTYNSLMLDDYYRTISTQEFILRITLFNYQDFILKEFNMPVIVVKSIKYDKINNSYDFIIT